jgi:PAS domain S-box-containing protein
MAKILIVDDDFTFVHLLTNLVASFGYTPVTANQGSQVFNIIKKDTIDLILLDIFMPILSGIEVLKRIKSSDDFKHIPVIMITGLNKANLMTDSFEAGASDFIIKPISPIVLQARLSTIISKQKDIQRLEQEIRERKKAESSLRKLSIAMEQSPGIIFLTDPRGRIEYANLKCIELSGYKLDEILGQKPAIFQSTDTTGVTYDSIWKIITKGGTWKGHLCNRKQNGELFWVQCSISPVLNDEGHLTNFLAVQEDITERLEAEKKLYQKTESLKISESRFRTIIEATADGLIVIGKNKVIHFVNPAAEKLLGKTARDLVGEKFLYPLIPNQITEIIIQRSNESDIIADYCVVETETDEGPVWVASFREIMYKNETIVEDNQDPKNEISEHKTPDKDIQLTDESANKVSERHPHKDIQLPVESANTDFISNISHEFRTPMHAIISFANFGIKKTGKVSDEKLLRYFEQIKNSADRLMPLIDDLMELSSLEAGIIPCNQVTQDLFPTLMTVIQEQEKIAQPKNISIQVAQTNEHCKAIYSKSCLIKVIRHIIQNAIRFSPEHSSIHISTESISENNHQYQKISISDNGIGVPEQELETIFNKFVQSSRTKTSAGGTGIGLAICKHIVNKHGGKIWATNNPDQGVTFSFTIPLS